MADITDQIIKVDDRWSDVREAKKHSGCTKEHVMAWQNGRGDWLLVHPDGSKSKLVNKSKPIVNDQSSAT
ncbi:hypothetical protein HN682_08040 [Candidatus Peregrinibacteria bacterium]|jgi:hypothetical protein|nr:hypothetical protein [Candidatus Peregrinibacteria bacterium]